MQNGGCCYKTYPHDIAFKINLYVTDFITVHTFGGRGSPSF
jgi:hypothetical protein